MANRVGTYLSGLLIIACFSYLFKENRLYRYTEHIYVGFGGAHAIVMGWQNIKEAALVPLSKGNLTLLIPVLLGLLLYARFIKSLSHLNRVSLSFMMGVAAGVTITGSLEAQFIKQVRATILPLTSISNLVMVMGTISTLAFFLFIPLGSGGKERTHTVSGRALEVLERVFKGLSVVGRATIMVAFGSAYGYVVMARLSYLIARLQFLLGTCIPLIPQ